MVKTAARRLAQTFAQRTAS